MSERTDEQLDQANQDTAPAVEGSSELAGQSGEGPQKRRKKGAIIAVAALAVVIVAAVFAYSALPGLRASMPYELSSASAADPFASSGLMACAIENADGDEVTLSELSTSSQKPIVMNLWTTWCPHCGSEMADYQKLYEEYGDRVEFAIVDIVDSPGEDDAARDYVKERGFTFPTYFDVKSEVRETLALVGVPVTVIVSTDGTILLNRSGEINYNAMKGTLDNLLNS